MYENKRAFYNAESQKMKESGQLPGQQGKGESRMKNKRRKSRGPFLMVTLNIAMLLFVAAILAFSVALVRDKLLRNAQNLGMALADSYASRGEAHARFPSKECGACQPLYR